MSELLNGGQCELPTAIAVCPECKGKLEIKCLEWCSSTGAPTQHGFDVLCVAEEEAFDQWLYNEDDDRDMSEVKHKHHQSDWQPVRDKVWKWINSEVAK